MQTNELNSGPCSRAIGNVENGRFGFILKLVDFERLTRDYDGVILIMLDVLFFEI